MQEFLQLNPPINRASTILFKDLEAFLARGDQLFDGYMYGLYGTPTIRELEARVARIEGGSRTIVVPSGLAAVTHPLLCLLNPGDHVILVDCAYGATRSFAKQTLGRLGVEYDFVRSNADTIADKIRANTRVVMLESPGYYTMEIQDIARIAAEGKAAGAVIVMDNSWGFAVSSMIDAGVDVCCSALSKYASGAGDLCMGAITVKDEALYRKLKTWVAALGTGVSSDEAYCVMRSMLSLDARLSEHAARGLEISAWMRDHPAVHRVMNPALPGDASHERFKKYFRSGNGLFSFVLKEPNLESARRLMDGLRLFRIGASWGSAHSLVSLTRPHGDRDIDQWPADQYVMRVHIGLEDFQSIKDDLEQALDRVLQPQAKAG